MYAGFYAQCVPGKAFVAPEGTCQSQRVPSAAPPSSTGELGCHSSQWSSAPHEDESRALGGVDGSALPAPDGESTSDSLYANKSPFMSADANREPSALKPHATTDSLCAAKYYIVHYI